MMMFATRSEAQPVTNDSKTTLGDNAAPLKKRRRRAAGGGAQDDCFACRKRAMQCDRKRPYCSQCIELGKECSGYKTTLTWGVGVASRGKLRGMSLPITDGENSKVLSNGPTEQSSRRKTSTSRVPPFSSSDTTPSSHTRRPSRPSVTSHPIPIQPASIQRQTSTYVSQQVESWDGQSMFAMSLPSSNSDDRPYAVSQSLQRLQTTLVPYQEAEGIYPNSASSTGSFFDTEFHTPLEYAHTPPFLSLLSDNQSAYSASVSYLELDSAQATQTEDEQFTSSLDPSYDGQDLPSMSGQSYSFDPTESTAYDAVNMSHDARHDTMTFGSPFISLMETRLSNPLSGVHPRMQFLIQYYDANICPFLVAFDSPQNPYRMHILQMAIHNESLQSALAALAVNNMRMRKLLPSADQAGGAEFKDNDQQHSWPGEEENMYKQSSIDQLNQQLANPVAAQDESVLATLLVLCLFHVCDSGFSKFRTQLVGVQKLLSMRQAHQRSTFTNWVEMFFMWFDVMTSAVNDREMEMEGNSLHMLEYSVNLGALEQFSGCDGRLFKLIARLGRLNLLAQGRQVTPRTDAPSADMSSPTTQPKRPSFKARTQRSLDARDYEHLDGNGWGTPLSSDAGDTTDWPYPTPPAPDARKEFWSEWHDIRARLKAWQVDISAQFTAVPGADFESARLGSHQGDMVHISESFRHSALLYIERLAHPLLPSASQQFQQHVSRALLHITALPVTSFVNKFLLWPLFITGTECVDADHRAIIRSRCIEIQRESGFYNNLSSLHVLERVWADVDIGRSDAGEMNARKRDSECVGAGPLRQAFRWRIAMDRVDGEYLII